MAPKDLTTYFDQGWLIRREKILKRFWNTAFTQALQVSDIEEEYLTLKEAVKCTWFKRHMPRDCLQCMHAFIHGYPRFEDQFIFPRIQPGQLYNWFLKICNNPGDLWEVLFPGVRLKGVHSTNWAEDLYLRFFEICDPESNEYKWALEEILTLETNPA